MTFAVVNPAATIGSFTSALNDKNYRAALGDLKITAE